MTFNRAIAIAVTLFAVGACQKSEAPDAPVLNGQNDAQATDIQEIQLVDAANLPMGAISVSAEPSGLIVRVSAKGLPAGMHGMHLHETGICEGPAFQSAGGHWNPGGKQHGRDNPAGAHLGDLANLQIETDGTGETAMMVGGAGMSGANGIADSDGTSLVVHAKADDYKTDPSGDSGDRIACAVLAAPLAN